MIIPTFVGTAEDRTRRNINSGNGFQILWRSFFYLLVPSQLRWRYAFYGILRQGKEE